MGELQEFLPFLIPLFIIQIGFLVYTLIHIFKHDSYKMGNRTIWLIIVLVFMNFVGPILYFILGKKDE